MVIEFATLEDLERIYRAMVGAADVYRRRPTTDKVAVRASSTT